MVRRKVLVNAGEWLSLPRHISASVSTDKLIGDGKVISFVGKKRIVFGLKGNPSDLHEDVKVCFENESISEKITTHNKGHGRIETREYLLETEIEWLHKKTDWVGIGVIGMNMSSKPHTQKGGIV